MEECQVCSGGIVSATTGDGIDHEWPCPDCSGTGRITKKQQLKQVDGIEALNFELAKIKL